MVWKVFCIFCGFELSYRGRACGYLSKVYLDICHSRINANDALKWMKIFRMGSGRVGTDLVTAQQVVGLITGGLRCPPHLPFVGDTGNKGVLDLRENMPDLGSVYHAPIRKSPQNRPFRCVWKRGHYIAPFVKIRQKCTLLNTHQRP